MVYSWHNLLYRTIIEVKCLVSKIDTYVGSCITHNHNQPYVERHNIDFDAFRSTTTP